MLQPHAKQSVQDIPEWEQYLQPKNLQTSSSSKKKSCIQKKSTIGIQKQKFQSKVRPINPLTSQTCLFLKNWRKITQNKSALDIAKGYKIPFIQKPTQTYHPRTQPTDPIEDLLISSKISYLLEKGAIEEVDMPQLHYLNSLFLVAKRSGGKRPVINLRPLHRFILNKTFRMESILLLKDILKPNSFLAKINLKDAFYSIPIAKKSRKYLQSVYLPQQALPILRRTIWNFNSSSSVFQDFKACYCSSPHKRYISHHLCGRSTHCCRDVHRLSEPYKTSNFSSGIPGFPNQLQKIHNNSNPEARILGLHNRFNLCDSCPPIDRIISPKASKKKGTDCGRRWEDQRLIRQLSRFIGLCTSIKYAVSQAPLHYWSLQFLRNSILKGR